MRALHRLTDAVDWAAGLRRRSLPRLQSETLMLTLATAVGLATGVLAATLIGVVAVVQRVSFGTGPVS